MVSTRWEDSSFAVAAIGNRTDPSGASVNDYSAEESRLLTGLLTEGYFEPNDFQVAPAGGNMNVVVGSGTAKKDRYIVPGTAGGQGDYLVRLESSSKSITIDAAASSGTRIDQIWLVVEDQAYETNGRSLPRLAYRKGNVGASAPGPESAWRARSLLATITVAANVTSINAGAISDQRAKSSVKDEILKGVLTRVEDIENSLGGHLISRFTWTGGNNPTFSNLPQDFDTFEFMGQFRFEDSGQFEGTFRLNGVNDGLYVSVATTTNGNGNQTVDSTDLGINLRAGRYGSTFSSIWARFTSTGDHNRISAVGNGFGRHGSAAASRYITQFGGYLIDNSLNTIRFNVGGPMSPNLSTFALYGYR